jgi:hypothetical protein
MSWRDALLSVNDGPQKEFLSNLKNVAFAAELVADPISAAQNAYINYAKSAKGASDISKGISLDFNALQTTIVIQAGAASTAFSAFNKSLANLAATDLKGAQAQFAGLATSTGLSTAGIDAVLGSTSEYTDSLKEQATAMGISLTNTKGETDATLLRNFALGQGEVATLRANEALKKHTYSLILFRN